MDNKGFRGYWIYALGEIGLVVIGILIALQINNWNEERKTGLQEVKMLKQLRADLIDNFNEITGIGNTMKLKMSALDSINRYFEEDRELDTSLVKYFRIIRLDNIFNSANTTYKYLSSTGINVMSDDSLRIAVTDMYERDFKNIQVRWELESALTQHHLLPLMRKHFKPDPDYKEFLVLRSWVPLDFERLKSNYELQTTLLDLHGYIRNRNRRLNSTLEKLDNLIQRLGNQINRMEQ